MKNETIAARRDEVLFTFHQQCDHPTADQIIEWVTRYPEFADDIRAHAAARLDWIAVDKGQAVEPEPELIARGRSRALNAIHNAQASAKNADADESSSFESLMQASAMGVPEVARAVDIERSIVADMVAGRMGPPLGTRFVYALASVFRTSHDAIHTALARARGAPRLGHAKARQPPTVVERSYEEIVRSSDMPPDRKSYWLDED